MFKKVFAVTATAAVLASGGVMVTSTSAQAVTPPSIAKCNAMYKQLGKLYQVQEVAWQGWLKADANYKKVLKNPKSTKAQKKRAAQAFAKADTNYKKKAKTYSNAYYNYKGSVCTLRYA